MTATPLGRSTAPIFVVGHPRSGTTLLRLILNEHSRIVIPPEAHVASYLRRVEHKFGSLRDPGNRRAAVLRLVEKDRMAEWGFPTEVMVERLMAADPPTPGGLFAALMSLWTEKEGKPRWGEKTPGTYRYLPEVDAWFPDCQVVHIVRDGRDVAVSNLTPPFSDMYDKGNVFEVAVRWKDALARCRRAEQRFLGPGRFLQVRYEDLTDDPETIVRRLCAFLHEEFEPAMLEYHRHAGRNVARGDKSFHQRTSRRVDKGRVERWRQDASPEFVCAFEGLAGRELAQLGYRLSGWKPSPALARRILLERLRPRRLIHNYKPPRTALGRLLQTAGAPEPRPEPRPPPATAG